MKTDIKSALELLQIDNVKTKDSIKKAYRSLMKKNHPDSGGSSEICIQISKAYKLLNTAFDNGYFDKEHEKIKRRTVDMSGFKAQEKVVIRLSILQLDKILNKEKVYITVGGKKVQLDKGMLLNCEVVVVDTLTLESNGLVEEIPVSSYYSYMSRNLTCNAVLNKESSLDESVGVSLGGKCIKVSRLGNNCYLAYNFDNFTVEVSIVR